MMNPSMDTETFPALRNLSAAFVQRLLLVPKLRPARREYVYVPAPMQRMKREAAGLASSPIGG